MNSINLAPYLSRLRELFGEHYFITIFCAFLVVTMVLSCYRGLRSVSSFLPPFLLILVLVILLLHWTQTRTEPKFMSPVVDFIGRFIPGSEVRRADGLDAPEPRPKPAVAPKR